MNYVYSTLSTDVNYTLYEKQNSEDRANINKVERHILIKGGANVSDKFLRTPQGIANKVTDEDLAELEAHPVFQTHQKNGFVKVAKREVAIDKAVSDMSKKDKSAPRSAEDYVKGEGKITPVLNKTHAD